MKIKSLNDDVNNGVAPGNDLARSTESHLPSDRIGTVGPRHADEGKGGRKEEPSDKESSVADAYTSNARGVVTPSGSSSIVEPAEKSADNQRSSGNVESNGESDDRTDAPTAEASRVFGDAVDLPAGREASPPDQRNTAHDHTQPDARVLRASVAGEQEQNISGHIVPALLGRLLYPGALEDDGVSSLRGTIHGPTRLSIATAMFFGEEIATLRDDVVRVLSGKLPLELCRDITKPLVPLHSLTDDANSITAALSSSGISLLSLTPKLISIKKRIASLVAANRLVSMNDRLCRLCAGTQGGDVRFVFTTQDWKEFVFGFFLLGVDFLAEPLNGDTTYWHCEATDYLSPLQRIGHRPRLWPNVAVKVHLETALSGVALPLMSSII